jgi:transcriptional regulator with XRE-family HTH domain
METTKRRRVVVDNSELARRIGSRLKQARLRAGLTQQQLAADRYTKAYVSALENGLVKPSMAALDYFSARLGTTASRLINDESRTWSRLEADIQLASGKWQGAADAYESLLDFAADSGARAELLCGRAEALARLDRGSEAAAAASEAADLFTRLGRHADAARANYWLAFAEYEQENTDEAKAILGSILARVRAGLDVEPDFKVRLLMALSSVESHEGRHAAALAYLEEVRGLADELDDRRRATYLFDLAYSYRETGDLEAAIRAGMASLVLFRAMDADAEVAALENDLARAHLALGNVGRAEDFANDARARFERLRDQRWLADVDQTEAEIALAKGQASEALARVDRALDEARASSNQKAEMSALLTKAKAHLELGQGPAASACYQRAADLARESGRPGRIREVLGAWADVLASQGEHQRAYELTREALGAG